MQQLSCEEAYPHLKTSLLIFNSFYVRYEDDTEKANDKKAAQLRNKVKKSSYKFSCDVGQNIKLIMLSFELWCAETSQFNLLNFKL